MLSSSMDSKNQHCRFPPAPQSSAWSLVWPPANEGRSPGSLGAAASGRRAGGWVARGQVSNAPLVSVVTLTAP